MLTDAKCRSAKGASKTYKLPDAGGLFLSVTPKGYRSWRHKYRFGDKEKLHVLGAYPQVGLKEARELRDAGKRLLEQGIDPAAEAKRIKLKNRMAAADSFELLAREWYEKQKPRWKPVHAADVIESLERDVFGDLGKLPVSRIDSLSVLATLQKVEKRGAVETAHRLLQRISAVFVYGIAQGRVANNPAASLGKALTAKPPARLRPAVITIKQAREVLAITDTAEATPVVKLASRFLALTAQRPGMVRWLEWDEISGVDMEGDQPCPEATWIVPAAKMKQEKSLREDQAFDHPVPLAPAAVDVLREVWLFSSGSRYVFPGNHSTDRPMSENALSYLYIREGLGGRHVPHGWRATFSSILNEWVGDHGRPRDPLVIDLMLAHTPTGLSPSELRYMRAAFLERRRAIATIWSDMLLEGAVPVDSVVQGRRRRKI